MPAHRVGMDTVRELGKRGRYTAESKNLDGYWFPQKGVCEDLDLLWHRGTEQKRLMLWSKRLHDLCA